MTGWSGRMRVASSRKALVIRERPTAEETEQIHKSAKSQSGVQVAVDIVRRVVAVPLPDQGFYADCEAALLEEGSRQENIYGVGWLPDSKQVLFGESPLNTRPAVGHSSMAVEDPGLRAKIEEVIRERFED